MSEADPTGFLKPPPRCRHCQDVIGAYEPVVLVTGSGQYQTSLTARPELHGTEHACYHSACFEEIQGD